MAVIWGNTYGGFFGEMKIHVAAISMFTRVPALLLPCWHGTNAQNYGGEMSGPQIPIHI
jgi:hypothetical protein